MTLGAFADKLCARRRFGCVGEVGGMVELRELCDDIAVECRFDWDVENASPLRKGGGSYVTPNSGCWQYGQAVGSEMSISGGSSGCRGAFGSRASPSGWCSGRCGSARLI